MSLRTLYERTPRFVFGPSAHAGDHQPGPISRNNDQIPQQTLASTVQEVRIVHCQRKRPRPSTPIEKLKQGEDKARVAHPLGSGLIQ